ncbi:hypothetical protein A2501_03650 [Candidatus Uhrbacteria bacterium RIFOXYC12_FULL_57_11]|nr:MAG: hypothetical protein A2501_03650 [Candidatus Uhrbacteria bacterium RIFOXYC12_FULL_57_11]
MPHSINFLHRAEPDAQHRKFQRSRRIRLGALVLCGLVAAWALFVLFAAGQVVASALDGRDALYRARDAATALDFVGAGEELAEADNRFAAAERGFILLRTARFLPFVSDQIAAADTMLSSGREMINALETVVDIGAELVRLTGFSEDEIRQMRDGLAPSATFDDLSSETKRAILERLSSSASDLSYLAARARP